MNLLNSKLYIFLDKVSNLFLLNVLVIITSIPIVTAFPAFAAMFSVIRQWKLKGETTVFKPFFYQFKLNFKQSFLISLLWIPFLFLLYIDFFFIIQINANWKIYLFVPYFFISFIFVFMSAYLFPVMVHYNMRIRDILKNSFVVSLVYFPTTLMILILSALCIFLLLFMPMTCLIIFSVWANLVFLLANRSFQKIEKLKTTESI